LTGGITAGIGLEVVGQGTGDAITATGLVDFTNAGMECGTLKLNALEVTNTTTFGDIVSMNSSLEITGAVSLGAALTVTGDTTLTGNVMLTDTTTAGGLGKRIADIGTYVDCLPATLNNVSTSDLSTAINTALTTTTLAEDYHTAAAAAATPAELLYTILACVSQFAISSTTLTTYKLDGTTPSGTYTLDSATAPTLRDRAT
jgi:hypothetical protein